jgi:small ligand-binding sensory domain FIST
MRQRTLTTRIGAGLSTAEGATVAAVKASREAGAALDGREPDLAFLFLSPHHLEDADEAAGALREVLSPRCLLGCVAEGVLARDRELEDGPAAAVWAGSLPGAEIECFHASAVAGGEGAGGWPDLADATLVALLVDPFSFPVGSCLERLNESYGAVPLVGGIATGLGRPGTQALIAGDEVYTEGVVGAVLAGVAVRTLVSQGCAPFGREAVITSADGNVIDELAGERALDRLREDVAALPPEQRLLASRGVLAGLVIDENQAEYRRGDFLIRGLLGADEETGALTIGEHVRVGQTVRFHFRDAATADEDLRENLADVLGGASAAGALVFTCNGRGTNMFLKPHHDARVVSEAIASRAIAGFFAGGEIGPVGGRAFLHGFTATLALFVED